MVEASCHCGSVSLEIDSPPEEVTECNCSMCRRYGVLWAYYSPRQVRVLPPRSAHRRLPVGQQILRVPPLPQLRLRLALGRHGSQARPDGCERTPHGPGGPRRCPRAPPRRRRHRSVHRLTICGEVANNVRIALFIQVRVRPVLLISRAHKYQGLIGNRTRP